MKKKVISIGIFMFIGIIGLFYNSNNKNTFTKDGVTYALTLDGASVNTFPSKGRYRADVKCSNAAGKWLYDEWTLAIEDITSNSITCDIDFTTIEKINLSDYIINLSGSEQGTGQVVNENGYRYEGKEPNNYIWFNNELWRIIGVFDESSHGQSGQNLVKIIRNNSIGGLAWDKNDTNDWTTSSLMNLLNGAYLNSENGTGEEFCYGYSTTIPSNCDYTETGINDTYKPMIKSVTWHLGGHTPSFSTTDTYYTAERGTTEYNGMPTSVEGYIGLMYTSDYGYSVLASSCARTTYLGSYSKSTCSGQSWLYGQGDEWTLTPSSASDSYVNVIYNVGYMTIGGALGPNGVRPVLYLDSNVYVIDGNGSISDPYIIGM